MTELRDKLNDAITKEILRQLGPGAETIDTGYAIHKPGDAVNGDTLIDVELIVDAILSVLDAD